MELLKIIKGLVLAIVLVGFFVNSIKEFEKYLGDKTMVSIYNEPTENLKLPLVTVCGNPPLKDNFFTPSIAFQPLDFKTIQIENLTEVWQSRITMNNVSIETLSYSPNSALKIERINTIQLGTCYIIEDYSYYDSSKLASIQINFESNYTPSELSIYIHTESDR